MELFYRKRCRIYQITRIQSIKCIKIPKSNHFFDIIRLISTIVQDQTRLASRFRSSQVLVRSHVQSCLACVSDYLFSRKNPPGSELVDLSKIYQIKRAEEFASSYSCNSSFSSDFSFEMCLCYSFLLPGLTTSCTPASIVFKVMEYFSSLFFGFSILLYAFFKMVYNLFYSRERYLISSILFTADLNFFLRINKGPFSISGTLSFLVLEVQVSTGLNFLKNSFFSFLLLLCCFSGRDCDSLSDGEYRPD